MRKRSPEAVISRGTGILLILVGLSINPYSMGIFAPDGSIDSLRIRVAIISIGLAIMTSGVVVIVTRPRWASYVGVSLTSFILCIALAEGISISTNLFAPTDYSERHALFYGFYRPDPQLGFKMRSNLEGLKVSWLDEDVSGIYSTDAYGFRNVGRDYSRAKTYIIGDSFAFGAWVDRDETFYGILESDLQEPVITLGVGGYGFFQYVVLMKTFMLRYRPETVILGVFANDLSRIPVEGDMANYYTKEGWVRYEAATPSHRDKSVIARGISILRRASSSLFYEKPWASRKKLPNGIVLHAQRGASKTYFEAAEYVEVEAALSDIITVADQGDARLLIVLFPSKESAYEHEYRRLFPGDYLGIEERGYTRICAMAKARDVDCIDLTAMFRHRAREGERLYFDEDPHWNESGHRLAAEIIGKHLRR